MTVAPAADLRHERLRGWLDAAAGGWLVALPALRPLVWSGDPADAANLGYACLLAAAIATGLLRRALGGESVALGRAGWLGIAFLALAGIGAWRSPYPYQAWATWANWVLHLGAAVALADAIRARPGLLIAGLVAGMGAECATLAAQVRWERPALLAQLALDPGLVEHERQRDQYAVRAASWRLEGTFLLANTLAAYLITLLPLVGGLAWSAWRSGAPGRWAWTALAALGALGLARTGSKMGILALILAVVVAAAAALRGTRRRLAVAGLVAVVVVALAIAPVRRAVEASATVRLDYWRAAAAMLAERPMTGHGLDGFQLHYPRFKQPAAEETVIAHNEPLQAAVDLGLPAAGLLLAWWAMSLGAAWRARRERVLEVPSAARIGSAIFAGVVLAWGFLGLDVLDARALTPLGELAYAAALIGLAVVLARALPLPRLPGWAAPIGLLACLIHAGADFHLHSPQVVGPLALLGVLACDGRIVPCRASRMPAIAALLVLLVVGGIALAAGLRHDLRERAGEAEGVLRRLVLATRAPHDEARLLALGADLEGALHGFAIVVDAQQPPEQVLATAAVAELAAASLRWPADPPLAAQALAIAAHASALEPAQAERFTQVVDRFAERWPDHVVFVAAAAEHHRRLARLAGDHHPAAAPRARELLARAVTLYPTHLPLRRQLAAVARLLGDDAAAEAQLAEASRLLPYVHPTNR